MKTFVHLAALLLLGAAACLVGDPDPTDAECGGSCSLIAEQRPKILRDNLLANLRAVMESDATLFGQQRFSITGIAPDGAQWLATDGAAERSDVRTLVGQHPAVFGLDAWDLAMKPASWAPNGQLHAQAARQVYAAGGVVTMDWHMRGCNADELVGPGFHAAGNEACLCRLANDDAFAQGWLVEGRLARLADALVTYGLTDVPIIFRPMHEMGLGERALLHRRHGLHRPAAGLSDLRALRLRSRRRWMGLGGPALLREPSPPQRIAMSPEAARALVRIDWAAEGVEAIRFKDGEGPDDLAATGKRLVRLYAAENQDVEVHAAEVAFELLVADGVTLRGVFDVLLAGDRVREMKTAARDYDEGTLARHVQVSAYAWAYPALFGCPAVIEVVALLKTKVPRIVKHEVSRSSAEQAWFVELAVEVAGAINTGVYPPNPSWACADCEYAEACQQSGGSRSARSPGSVFELGA